MKKSKDLSRNVGKTCRIINNCGYVSKSIYDIEGYSESNGGQYCLRAREFYDECLAFGWRSTDQVSIIEE